MSSPDLCTKIINPLFKDCKIHFSALNVIVRNIRLGEQLLSKYFLIYFLKICPIFVVSVHNFGRDDNDTIYWKKCYFSPENMKFHVQGAQKILKCI